MCVLSNLRRSQFPQFGTGAIFLFFKMSSYTFSLLCSPFLPFSCLSLSLSFSLSMFLSGRGACGPVGRGLIPSAWGFCQRLVPFCVMVLTERTPHLTPIELWGWAAGQPARANAARVQRGNLMAVFILCCSPLMEQKKSLGFLFQHFHCQVRGARRGYAQEE